MATNPNPNQPNPSSSPAKSAQPGGSNPSRQGGAPDLRYAEPSGSTTVNDPEPQEGTTENRPGNNGPQRGNQSGIGTQKEGQTTDSENFQRRSSYGGRETARSSNEDRTRNDPARQSQPTGSVNEPNEDQQVDAESFRRSATSGDRSRPTGGEKSRETGNQSGSNLQEQAETQARPAAVSQADLERIRQGGGAQQTSGDKSNPGRSQPQPVQSGQRADNGKRQDVRK